MKFGCCGSMVAVEPDGTGAEIAGSLKKIGYDYIELSLAHIMRLPEVDFRALRSKLIESGIKCEACNNFFPPELKLTGPTANMGSILDYTGKAIERAGLLGSEIIVFGSGKAKNVDEGFPMIEAWGQIEDLLKQIDALAGKYGITIVIEPLRKAECNIINNIGEALMLVKKVNRNHIQMLADYYHMVIEHDPPKILEEASAHIRHVHLAKVDGRTFPKNIEEDDYAPFIESLNNINYDKRISIEAYSNNFIDDAKLSLEFLKKHFR